MSARLNLALGLYICATACAGAQTLARKGWAGSGIHVEPWYQSAVFYQIDPLTFQDSNGDGFGDLAGITSRLPYLERLGVDAILLSPLPLEPPGSSKPLDPVYGSTEDFDQLERDANSHKLRVLVDIATDLPREQMLATARFWLSRGVAGLHLVGAAPDRSQILRELRAIAGPTRILVSDTAPEPAVASRHPVPRIAPDLVFDRHLTQPQKLSPATLRAALMAGNLLSDLPNLPRSLTRLGDGAQNVAFARIAAAALLLGRGAPMLYFGQELGMEGGQDPTPMQWGSQEGFSTVAPWIPAGKNSDKACASVEDADPDSLLNWYRKLTQLHHEQSAVRTGTLELLPVANPALVAWVRRPRMGNAPVVLVVVNLSQYAVVTAVSSMLSERQARLSLLAKSAPDALSGPTAPATLSDALSLEPYGVYVGQIRNGPGLESVVLPARATRRRERSAKE